MKNIKTIFFVLGIFVLLLGACESELVYTPKPRAYPKVEFPARTYQAFQADYCKFNFQIPTYAQVEKDTTFFDGKPANECWFDINIPQYNATIHCSYSPLDTDTTLQRLHLDAFNLAYEHDVKSDYIDEFPIKKDNDVYGFIFDINGPAASPFQFYLTDSTTHFLRGALYFDTQARPDSLAPVIEFIKVDAMNMINTFEWD